METNELPEEVKSKIMEYANEAYVGMDENKKVKDSYIGDWTVGYLKLETTDDVVFGYRLSQSLLQQRDEELKQLNANNLDLAMDYQDHLATIKQLEEQLKAKDEENERLRDGIKKFIHNWRTYFDLSKLPQAIQDLEVLLSQSTDKP